MRRDFIKVALLPTTYMAALMVSAEIRVTDFGAKGDGISDDTVAICRAVAAFEQRRPKKTHCVRRHKDTFSDAPFEAIVFPKGIYRVAEPIIVHGDAMILGENGSKILFTSSDREGLYFRDTYNLVIKGLTFCGGLCQVRMWTRNHDCSYLHVADCEFRNCRGTSICSVSFCDEKGHEPIETAYGEVRGLPFNNSTLMLVERCRFMDNATALRLYSDGVTVRDCSFVAPKNAASPQLNVGSGGNMGVEMYFRNLDIDYEKGMANGVPAVLFNGGRGIFEEICIHAHGDLVAFRSLARFNEYHKPSCLDLRDISIRTGAAPVITFVDDEFPNRVSVYGLKTDGVMRQKLFAFDREPTSSSVRRAYSDQTRQMKEPPEEVLAFTVKHVDGSQVDVSLPVELRQYVRKSVPDGWTRPLEHESGSVFSTGIPKGPVFVGAPIEALVEKARLAGGGTVVLPGDWQDVHRTIDVPDNTRITCRGRAALWMRNANEPIFRVRNGIGCVLENLMMIDGLHAVEVVGGPNHVRLLDCAFFDQKASSVFVKSSGSIVPNVEVSGGRAYTPYFYRGNGKFTVDCFWYEESTERDKDEYRPSYAAMVNEKGGQMLLRDFLGVPCYFQHTPKADAYVFGRHPERRGEFRWIDNYGILATVNFRYGGEWGGLTSVYHFGDAVTWIEGGRFSLGNFYLKSDWAVVVADSSCPDVTIVDTVSGHHSEPLQVLHKVADEKYDVAEVRMCDNYPFGGYVPVWPKGRERDANASYDFVTDFRWNGQDPVRLELEASCMAGVWLNGEHVGNGPRPETPKNSRMAEFKLLPQRGANRLLVRTVPGNPGFLYARIVEGVRMIARTAVNGDFSCGLPLTERPKPLRTARDKMNAAECPETALWQKR